MSSMPNQMARKPPSRHRGSRSWFLKTSNSVASVPKKMAVAEGLAVDLALGQLGEDLLDRLAVVEEVVVGAEEGVDAGALGR